MVDEDIRGQGIGRQLMEEAENLARSKGCKIIELTSGLRRAKEGTHEFYKALGYQNEGQMAKLYLCKKM